MLKQVVLTKRLQEFRSKLAALVEKATGIETRRAELQQREAELETAVNEITENSTEEERTAVDEATAQFETDQQALEAEATQNSADQATLRQQIADTEAELEQLNQKGRSAQAPTPAPQPTPTNQREDGHTMNKRSFFGMTHEQRDAFLGREDVKGFLAQVVSIAQQKRDVSGANLAVPDVMLEVIRENIEDYSKLLRHVNLKPVDGTARENIVGPIPEAVWMEMIAAFNEMNFALYNVEVDGFAVGGFIPVANSLLADTRYPALASEVMTMIAAAIGLALDKAIIYGTGIKMPLGIVPRLAQTAKPDNYPKTARPWQDLHTRNIFTIRGGTADNYTKLDGIDLYKAVATATGAAMNKFARGGKFWVMSQATWNYFVVAAMSINAAGAIVTGANMTMPVVGGEVILLDFMPEGEFVFGYDGLYLLAERGGVTLSRSEHARFLKRQTVFAGEARYDGTPVIAEGFIAAAIDGGEVTTSLEFAEDEVNEYADLATLEVVGATLIPSFSPVVTDYACYVANATSTVKLKSTAKESDSASVTQKLGSSTVAQNTSTNIAVGDNVFTVTVINGVHSKVYTVNVNRAAAGT